MKYSILFRSTLGAGHLQSVDDQAGAQVGGGLPTDDHPGGQIDHGSQVQPPLTGTQVGNVSHQCSTGRMGLWSEVPAQLILEDLGSTVDHRGGLIRPLLHRLQPQFTHQLGHQPHRSFEALLVELSSHTPTASTAALLIEDPGDLDLQHFPAGFGNRGGADPGPPRVERGTRHFQLGAHPVDRVVVLLRLDQG